MNYITKDQVPAHLKSDVTLLEFSYNVRYDLDLARIYLEDFLNGYTDYSVQLIDNDYLIIYEDKALRDESYFKLDELEELEIDELIELLDGLENYYYDEGEKDCLIDSLLQYANEEYYEKHYNSVNWRDLESDYYVSGYHQGDAIAVKTVGDVSISEEYITNLFYDVPVSGYVEIYSNDKLLDELYLEEFLDNSYTWDKVQVINNISNAYLDKDYHALLVEYLIENLPEELDYI